MVMILKLLNDMLEKCLGFKQSELRFVVELAAALGPSCADEYLLGGGGGGGRGEGAAAATAARLRPCPLRQRERQRSGCLGMV